MVMQTLQRLDPRGYFRPNAPRSLRTVSWPDFAISMAITDPVSGRIKIRPSAATGYPAISRVD
jgi:hypothetical protein